MIILIIVGMVVGLLVICAICGCCVNKNTKKTRGYIKNTALDTSNSSSSDDGHKFEKDVNHG